MKSSARRSDAPLYLGIDLGTSSLKVLFITGHGEIVARSESKISSKYGSDGAAEQNAKDYLLALKRALNKKPEFLHRVISIGLSGQTPSLVCIDSKGEATFPVMTWQDNRPINEAKELEKEFGNPLDVVGTSLPWAASACPAKLLWISRNHPTVVKKTRWLLQPKDFLGFHLTGAAISDPWSTKGICNVQTLQPIDDVLGFAGWQSSQSPQLIAGYESRGKLTAKAAEYFGFPHSGIPVSVGWSDAMSGMLSLGTFTEPSAFIFTGTSAIVGLSTNKLPADGKNLYIIPTTCAPLGVIYGPTQSSGSAIAWFGKLHNLTPDQMIDLALTSKKKHVPLFTPYLSGERAPIWRSDIRGSFFGLDAQDSVNDLARAVLEGISFGERHVLEIAKMGAKESTIAVKLGGHAGKDPRWDEIRLRTLGVELVRYNDADTTTRGAAMLAAVATGMTLVEAVTSLSASTTISKPSFDQHQYATDQYCNYLTASQLTATFTDSKNQSRERKASS